jgi:flagellar protein FliS
MFSPRRAAHGAASYQATGLEIQVASADAHRLVTLLFEGFDASVSDAQGALQTNDIERKCRAITRAMRIVDEGLRQHLNLNAGGALAQDLDELYAYVSGRLMLANARNDSEMLGECKRVMRPLHDAWVAIGQKTDIAR